MSEGCFFENEVSDRMVTSGRSGHGTLCWLTELSWIAPGDMEEPLLKRDTLRWRRDIQVEEVQNGVWFELVRVCLKRKFKIP